MDRKSNVKPFYLDSWVPTVDLLILSIIYLLSFILRKLGIACSLTSANTVGDVVGDTIGSKVLRDVVWRLYCIVSGLQPVETDDISNSIASSNMPGDLFIKILNFSGSFIA